MTDDRDQELNGGDLERIEALLRETTPQDGELIDPPADLWDRIEADAGIPPAGAEAPPPAIPEPGADEERRPAPVVSLERRSRRVNPLVVLSAAAALLVAVIGITVVAQRADDDSVLLASADLVYVPEDFDELGAEATARVSLVDHTGRLRVEIDESVLPNLSGEPADLELWLIEPDADGNPADLVSLGLIDPAEPGGFDIPSGYDPTVFFVVDISVEPRDGDAAHSGRSILRGPLTEA